MMIQKSIGGAPQLPSANCSCFMSERKEPVTGPIIVSGGNIQDVKATLNVDDNKIMSLEARMCGNPTRANLLTIVRNDKGETHRIHPK